MKINIKRYFQVLGISLVVVFVGFLAFLFVSENHIDSNLSPDEIATVSTEELDGKINVLVLGLDESGLRTDTIMVASYDMESDRARVLSIPRDTRIYIGSRYQKINAAHAMKASHGGTIGAQGTVEAVSRLTGIPIHFYVEFPFSAVEECIDIIGPVTFEIPDLGGDGVGMVYDDPVQDLHINLKPGVQELNGEQVVHLLRYRKGNLINGQRRTYKGGDVERISVQQDFIKAFVDQKLNSQLIADIPSLFSQLSEALKTNFAFRDVVKYAPALAGFDTSEEDAFKMWTLPGESGSIDGVSYYLCDLDATRTLIEDEFGFDASGITDGKKDVSSQSSNKSGSGNKTSATSSPKATRNTSSNTDDEAEPTSAIRTAAPKKTTQPSAEPTKAPSSSSQESGGEPSTTKTPTKEQPSSTKTPTKAED